PSASRSTAAVKASSVPAPPAASPDRPAPGSTPRRTKGERRMTDLAARFADLPDATKALVEKALPDDIKRKNVADYTDDETLAVGAIIDAALAVGATPDATAEPTMEADLDELPTLVDTSGLRRRLTAIADGPQAGALNQAWVEAGLGSLPELMDPDPYRAAEMICATYEGAILPTDPRYAGLRWRLKAVAT